MGHSPDDIKLPDPSIRQYAFAAREQTSQDFGRTNTDSIAEVERNLQKVLSLMLLSVFQEVEIGTRVRFDAFALLKTSLEVLISALHMAQYRAGVECLVLVRVALESACTALHIHGDPDAYANLKSESYRSTSAISYVKREVPIVGELWGRLSSSFVHVNYYTFGPRWEVSADGEATKSMHLQFGVRKDPGKQDKILMLLINLMSMILLKALETVLSEGDSDSAGWRTMAGTSARYYHNTDERIRHYHSLFTESLGRET